MSKVFIQENELTSVFLQLKYKNTPARWHNNESNYSKTTLEAYIITLSSKVYMSCPVKRQTR